MSSNTEEMNFRIPSYLTAVDTHTLANSIEDKSEFSALGTLSGIAYFVTKGIPLAAGSGASQLYNIVPTVGNWFGGNYEMHDYKAAVRDYDDDLGKYYEAHQRGIDAVGFVASSFAPGMGGVKLLRAGQTALRTTIEAGEMGSGFSRAFGLLAAPPKEKYLAQAIKEITSTGNIFSFTEANTIKAIGSGFWQQALEAGAFEVGVAATMYNSPVLDELSAKDMFINGLIGVGLGGTIGGTIETLLTRGAIKGAAVSAEREVAKYALQDAPRPGTSISDQIIYRTVQRHELPELPVNSPLYERMKTARDTAEDNINLEVRKLYSTLSSGDEDLAAALYQSWKVGSREQNIANLVDTTSIGRFSARTHTESEVARISTKLKKSGYESLTDDEFTLWADSKVTYLAIRGESAGSTFAATDKPEILSIFDRLRKDTSVKLTDDGITIGGKAYRHDNNPYMPYNIVGRSHLDTESRYIWAERMAPWTKEDNVVVTSLDIPLLEKALRDGIQELHIVPVVNGIGDMQGMYKLTGSSSISAFVKQQKQEVMNLLRSSDTTIQDVDTVVDKLLSYFGIKFNLIDDATSNGFWRRVNEIKKGMNLTGDVINLSPSKITDGSKLVRPFAEIVRTLKHEEGHSIFQAMLDARGVGRNNLDFATALPDLARELEQLSKRARPDLWKSKDPGVVEYRKTMHELFADAFSRLAAHPEELKKFPQFNAAFGHLVRPISDDVLDQMVTRIATPSEAEIAKIVNVREHVLRGEVIGSGGAREHSQWFARDEFRTEHFKRMKDAGARSIDQVTDPLTLPSYAKIFSVANHTKNAEGIEVSGLAGVMQRVKLFDDNARRVAAQVLSDITPDADSILPHFGNIDVIRSIDGSAGGIKFANADYGTQGSIAQFIGSIVNKWSKIAKEKVSESFTPILAKLAGDTDAAIEWGMLNERMRQLPQQYVLSNETGKQALTIRGSPEQIMEYAARGLPTSIEIKSPIVWELVKKHVEVNGANMTKMRAIRHAEGRMDSRTANTFYPIPRNPKNTPYFAFVVDDSIDGTGHSSMIYAATEKELETLKNSIQKDLPDHFKVLSKKDSENYYKAHGQFDYERTIHENAVDEFLKRKGKSSSIMPITDPQVLVENILDWHLKRASNTVREAVSLRYTRQFDALRQAAEETTNLASSRFGYVSMLEAAENAANSPALNTIKTALDIQKSAEYPYWTSINRMLDKAVSKVWSNVYGLVHNAKSAADLDQVNTLLKEHGYQGPLVTEALYKAMNSTVPQGTLTAFVNKANAVVASLSLRMDWMNALNNAIGHSVLYGTELKAVLGAIGKENADQVGALVNLKIPGTDKAMTTPGRLISNAISRFHDKNLRQWYRDRGFITHITEQYDQTIDQIALGLVGKSNIDEVFRTFKKIGDTGEVITGNKLAEEFNRFVAADTMKQLTDIAIAAGKMEESTALAYINTFVNRTQGNFIASQRPLMFQGPIGQAIGLFQTYQFNLLQQLLRHVENREGRVIATMAGLQAGIYGMNGMPAFNAINTHIIGNASGNKQHADFYNVAYSAAGKEAGDWLMYGFGSNFLGLFHPDLKNNLYVRGDINPRQLTLVPTNPANIPIVSVSAKFASNIIDTFSTMAAGGDVGGSVLAALEHNGISRPLAGMAQVMNGMARPDGKVVSTTNKDSISMAHDLYSLASIMRIAGAKPLDEALQNDLMYRIKAYSAKDSAKKEALGAAIKTSLLYGDVPDENQIAGFATSYAERGGKQDRWAQFMALQYKNATNSQANQMRRNLQSYKNQQLQELLGGYKVDDLAPQ